MKIEKKKHYNKDFLSTSAKKMQTVYSGAAVCRTTIISNNIYFPSFLQRQRQQAQNYFIVH